MTDQELNGRLDQIVDLVMRLDERAEKRFEQIDKRFERVEKRLDELEKRLDELEKLSDENVELTRSVETALLKEFRKWAISFESRFKANEILIGGFNERLIALEERVGDIERRSDTAAEFSPEASIESGAGFPARFRRRRRGWTTGGRVGGS